MCNFATVKPIVILLSLLLAAACTTTVPQTSDTEQLMGEALDAMGRHHLYEAERKAYSAAILSVDSTELADALTMLSLVYMLEGKEHQAEMVMAVLPREQTMELVRLQDQANDQGRRRERLVFGSLVGALLLAVGGGYWWNRRRTAAFQQKVNLLMQQVSQPAVRADIVKTKQGVDVLYAILRDENISQMGKREQLAVSETLHIVEPDLAAVIDTVELTPKETFYCIMHYYGKTDQQKAQCFCCTEQALRSTKSRLNKKLDIDQLSHRSTKGQGQVVN